MLRRLQRRAHSYGSVSTQNAPGAAVPHPVSEAFLVLRQLVLPRVFYWRPDPSSPATL